MNGPADLSAAATSPSIAAPSPAPARPAQTTNALTGRRVEVVLALLLLGLIAGVFWTQQRYPSLLGKLHAGKQVHVKGAISFDALLPVSAGMPLPTRVARTGVNWLWTNRYGMAFALPFGATLMSLFGVTAGPRRFGSAAANVMCGAVAGAPMGVCTNCATPIGQSLISAGASTRLSVAAMISSPSFNPIVVALCFLVFPLPLALMRLATPAALLLLLPWLVPEQAPGLRLLQLDWDARPPVQPITARMAAFAATWSRNLVRVTWMTLPWMLLAALLGALAAELLPTYGTHLHASVASVAAVAVFGTLLPVPMALDVALAFVLYGAGAPVPLVAALLCTLGPVSVYSLSALGRQLGPRAALRLGGATAALGSLAGIGLLFAS